MIQLSEALIDELIRYIEKYGWSFSLISHIFKLKHNITLTVKELQQIYKVAK